MNDLKDLCEFDRVEFIKSNGKKVNLKNISYTRFFSEYIYPCLAKEFLFSANYEMFAELIMQYFELTEKQWECVLMEWEEKEYILK